MPPLSTALLLFQSLSLNLAGLATLFSPASAGFDDLRTEVRHVLGAVLCSLGVAYIFTAFQPRQTRHGFLIMAAPFRVIFGLLFLSNGKTGTALWDAGNGIVNLVVVGLERRG